MRNVISRIITLTTPIALDESDIQILKTYVRNHFGFRVYGFNNPKQGQGPYAARIKDVDKDLKEIQKRVNEKLGPSIKSHI